jgi:Plasma-membrane choline transporter
MLTSVVQITRKFPGTLVSGVIGVIVGAAMAAWWFVTIVGVAFWAQNTAVSNGTMQATLIFCLFFFYWAASVISNTVHITVSGVRRC